MTLHGSYLSVSSPSLDHLLAAGWEVTVLNRGKTPSPFPPNAKLHFIKCDRFTRGRFREALRTCEWSAVVDFVAFRCVKCCVVQCGPIAWAFMPNTMIKFRPTLCMLQVNRVVPYT